jgi:hypothetical protein
MIRHEARDANHWIYIQAMKEFLCSG